MGTHVSLHHTARHGGNYTQPAVDRVKVTPGQSTTTRNAWVSIGVGGDTVAVFVEPELLVRFLRSLVAASTDALETALELARDLDIPDPDNVPTDGFLVTADEVAS